jgi:hypothetical protein
MASIKWECFMIKRKSEVCNSELILLAKELCGMWKLMNDIVNRALGNPSMI